MQDSDRISILAVPWPERSFKIRVSLPLPVMDLLQIGSLHVSPLGAASLSDVEHHGQQDY